MSAPAASSENTFAHDGVAAPARVLLMGDADAAGSPAWPAPPWIVAAVHQPGRDSLVHAALEQAIEAFVLRVGADGLAVWLDALEAAAAVPSFPAGLAGVAVVPDAARVSEALQQRAMALGVQTLLSVVPDHEELHRQLRWALRQAASFAALRAQLDDRKWTERAKGLLMSARELDEDGAFRLLRDAAMHAHLRLGEVARSVVQSAQRAEAVNLAGQQRMLSQRLVKLMAQRAAGIEVKRAKTLQDESCARVAANLSRLPALLGAQPEAGGAGAGGTDAVIDAWRRLEPLLAGKPSVEALVAADAAAQDLLTRSDALATAIAASGVGVRAALTSRCTWSTCAGDSAC